MILRRVSVQNLLTLINHSLELLNTLTEGRLDLGRLHALLGLVMRYAGHYLCLSVGRSVLLKHRLRTLRVDNGALIGSRDDLIAERLLRMSLADMKGRHGDGGGTRGSRPAFSGDKGRALVLLTISDIVEHIAVECFNYLIIFSDILN